MIQGDQSVRFVDRQHKRIGALAAADAPKFTELDLFRIPADAGFDPAEPFRLQLLVQRAVGAVQKAISHSTSAIAAEAYLLPAAPAPELVSDDTGEEAAKTALWQRIWKDRTGQIAGLAAMLLVLTGVFFFQFQATANERVFYWFRIGFLTVSLVFLGWYANAQLSVVNLMALAGTLRTGFTWDAFLLDPLVFIQWFAVAAALIFWDGGLLRLAVPLRRAAGAGQPDRPCPAPAAVGAALGPA